MATRFSGPRKAAIMLLALGEESAAEVMKNLSKEEIQSLVEHITTVDKVSPRDVDRVTGEYFRVAERKNFIPGPPETKIEFLKSILDRALGEEKSTKLIDGMLAESPESNLQRLTWHAPSVIAEFIESEHPQVIAVILANMGDPGLASEIVENFNSGKQDEVLRRLSSYKEIPQELLDEIEASLEEDMRQPVPAIVDDSTESKSAADGLESSPKIVESNLIRHIEQRNPELAEKIRSKLFSFEDFIKIDNYGIQKVLAQITNEDLVLALKTSSEAIQQHFLRNMSSQSAQTLREAIGDTGPLRIGDIEDAQKRLAEIAGRLNDDGELMILDRLSPP